MDNTLSSLRYLLQFTYFEQFQGHSWEHIIADVPFLSISVGGQGRVWGVAEDGTTYFRAGFADNPKTGSNDSSLPVYAFIFRHDQLRQFFIRLSPMLHFG